MKPALHGDNPRLQMLPARKCTIFSAMEISNYLSIHPVTVSKVFGKLRSMGIIKTIDGKNIISDMEALNALAEGHKSITY